MSDEQPPAPSSTHMSVDDAVQYGVSLHKQGYVEGAEQLYGRILAVAPDHPDANAFRGMALFQLGKKDEALAHIQRAAELAPDSADVHNNLGNVLQALGRCEEAIAAYQRALALRPDFADAYANLGRAHEELQQYEQALGAFQKAVFLLPYDPVHYRRLGASYYAVGRSADAVEVYRRWHELDPADPVAAHMLASCTGRDVPARADDRVVQRTFDTFAESFDRVLGRLKYRAPELIVNRVRELLGPDARLGDVLDLGCGTGLCGALLRPMAGRLVGIDLSPAMIAKARERGCYDDLVEGEITAYLDAHPAAWDAAVAADVLCYLGDLRPLFAAAARALRPGAPLAFTVEAALDPASPPYVLHAHGRYSQREDFVREALAAAGLEVVSVDRVHLRVELKVPVDGFLVVARRR